MGISWYTVWFQHIDGFQAALAHKSADENGESENGPKESEG